MNGPPPGCCGLRCNRNWRNRSPRSPSAIRRSPVRAGFARRGGVRVIYYFMLRPDVVFLADLYAKNEKENLTHAERNQLQKVASEVQREFGG